jgi:hypothetical protein
MKQNGASFCRRRFTVSSNIPGAPSMASALYGSIKSLERVFRGNRHYANALHGKKLELLAVQNRLTKPENISSARGFCR